MKTHGEAKPESPPSARQICPVFLLRGGHSWETKPNLGRMGHLGDGASERPIARNEPNFADQRASGGQTCETNPICTGVMRGASPVWAKVYGQMDMQRTSAKQSQFQDAQTWARANVAAGAAGGTSCTNKANSRPAGRRERSGIPHRTPATGAPSGDCFFPAEGYSVPCSMGPNASHELRRAA
jgi:hypothetical protein